MNKGQVDKIEYVSGTAFIASLSADHDVSVSCSGLATAEAQNLNITGKVYPHIANPIPRNVKFKEIKAVGFDAQSEYFYKIDPASCAVDNDSFIIYVDEETAKTVLNDESLAGWWDQGMTTSYADKEWLSGDCYIGSLGGTVEDVIISFPAAIINSTNL